MPKTIYENGDWQTIAEARRLQKRVTDLENQLAQLLAEKEALLVAKVEREVLARVGATAGGGEQVLLASSSSRELAADVRALTEVVARLVAQSALSDTPPDGHEGDTAEPSALSRNDNSRVSASGPIMMTGSESDAAVPDKPEASGTASASFWRRITIPIAIGGLLDISGSATAQALEYSYNRARGITVIPAEFEDADTYSNVQGAVQSQEEL